MSDSTQPSDTAAGPKWQTLSARDRRVAGVMVEKAKTTPAAYPLTLNAVRTGSNQKSNRYPVMDLQEEDVAESLERLREMGAAAEVIGGSRVAKYRHLLYDWLGVDKVEMAVMTELLLRGAQTVGELRGRAARMEPIADLASLRPVLASLNEKNLIVYLTPEGRGCVVTHALYPPNELERLRRDHGGGSPATVPQPVAETAAEQPAAAAAAQPTPMASSAPPATAAPAGRGPEAESLRVEVDQLREEVREFREELTRLTDSLRDDVDDVKRQLGI